MLKLDFSSYPNLITERLVLRQVRMNDANEIRQVRSDERVNEFLDRAPATNLDEAIFFIDRILRGILNHEWFYWAITIRGSDELIGTICLWNIDEANELAEIGYELKPAFQGRGIMQEAIASVINFGFNKVKLNIITAMPKMGNVKSIRLLLGNNFQLDSEHKFEPVKANEGLLLYYLKHPRLTGD